MPRLSDAYADAVKTMADMQHQGRMSHAERKIIELACRSEPYAEKAKEPAKAKKKAKA